MGAQQNETEQQNFGDADQRDKQRAGFGASKKSDNKNEKLKDFQKNLNKVFQQNLRVKQNTITKILDEFNLEEPNDNPAPNESEDQPKDFEVNHQNENEQTDFAVKSAGFNLADNGETKPDIPPSQQPTDLQQSIPNDPNTATLPPILDSLLRKRDQEEIVESESEAIKRVKVTGDQSAKAILEYSQTVFEKNDVPTIEIVLDNKTQLNAEKHKLCEELKSILEQKKVSDLKGDYRTGKRLNMKRVISYIASNYRKDKIWLRRTDPSQQNYRIFIGVDDSSSMRLFNQRKQRRPTRS